jgi:hypothetical protein
MDQICMPFYKNTSPFMKAGREYTANKRKKLKKRCSTDRKSLA